MYRRRQQRRNLQRKPAGDCGPSQHGVVAVAWLCASPAGTYSRIGGRASLNMSPGADRQHSTSDDAANLPTVRSCAPKGLFVC